MCIIQIKNLYQKEYKDELTSQKKQNEVEISKLLATTNVQTYTSGVGKRNGKKINYKKTRIIENGKDIEAVKKSEPYLRRIAIRKELQKKIDNVSEFTEKFEQDFTKFKSMYIKELQDELVESEKWLKNKHNSLNLSIQNELTKSIIAKNRKDYDCLFFKVEELKDDLENISEEKVLEYMLKNLQYAYNVRLDEKKKGSILLDKQNSSICAKKRTFVSAKLQKQMDAVYNAERSIKRDEKYRVKNMDRSYRYMCKQLGYFPDFLKKKLKNMPCNKGYLFNGIYFYGKKPADRSGVTVLFEKKKKDFFIHEYKGNWYILKQQVSTGRKNRYGKPIKKTIILKKEYHESPFKQTVNHVATAKKLGKIRFKTEKKVEPVKFRKGKKIKNVWNRNALEKIKVESEFTISEEARRHQAEMEQKEAEKRNKILEKRNKKENNRLVLDFGEESEDEYPEEDNFEEYIY